MIDIVVAVVVANLAAAAAIAVVLVVRRPVRAAFGAAAAYALWLVVPLAALGALLPARIVEVVAPAPAVLPAAVLPAAPAIVPPAVPPLAAPPPVAPAAPAAAPADPGAVAGLIWLAGAIAMFAWLMRNQSRFMADARAGFAGPAVAGFLRPRIVTPADFEDRFDSDERQIILAHETIHLRRNDARINALVALVRCVCWFNPLIHVAAHAMRIDQELACDAAVVERHPRAKAVYASALLKAQLAARPLPLGCYWPAGADHPLTERVEMLKRPAPGRARRIAGAGALAALALGACVGPWAAKPAQERFVIANTTTSEIASEVAPQTVRYEPQQQSPAPAQGQSQELPPPPMQPRAFSVPENMNPFGPPPALEVDSPIYLRGKVERIDFGDTRYVIFLRAGSIAHFYEGAPHGAPIAGPAFPNTALWELSPTNYFGNRDSITADLMGKNVEVSGIVATQDCAPACRIKVKDLIMPRSSEAPQPRTDDSLFAQFGQWYDTGSLQSVHGKVERIEFSDRTFDAYIRSESRSAIPGRLYQARSEYRFPRADIERALLNRTVSAVGWPARQAINTFCDPVCGLYATNFTMEDRSQLTPAGATLTNPSPYAQQRRGDIFMSIADFSAPLTLRGKITRYVPTVLGPDNPQLWIEAISVEPSSTFGSAAGTVWVVSGFPFEASQDWVGRTVVIRGFNAEDKRCQPQCLMAGSQIQLEPAPAPQPQPTRYEPQPTPPSAPPPDYVPFAAVFDADDPIQVRGKVTKVDLTQPYAYVWVQASETTESRPEAATMPAKLVPNTSLFRVMLGRAGGTPNWVEQSLIGKEVIVRGYRAKNKSCADTCLINGREMTIDGVRRSVAPSTTLPLHIVALRPAQLVVRSSSDDKIVDRRFEPGQIVVPRVGAGWTVSTPDGAAFEWRIGDSSLGALADAGPVNEQTVDDVMQRSRAAPAPN